MAPLEVVPCGPAPCCLCSFVLGALFLAPPATAAPCAAGDTDGDGILDVFEDLSTDGDCDNDDTDADATPDYLDPDDDGDAVLTIGEEPDPDGNGDPADARDTDGNGLPDYLDDDDDGDGILTFAEDANFDGDPTNDDSDGDGIPDYLDDVFNPAPVPSLGRTGIALLLAALFALALPRAWRRSRRGA